MDLRRGEVVAVPFLDAAQIDAERRGGAREAADQGGRKVGRGGEEGGRCQRGESEATREGGSEAGRRRRRKERKAAPGGEVEEEGD
jgi:hypothetical protein